MAPRRKNAPCEWCLMKRYAIMAAFLLALPAYGMAQGLDGDTVSPAGMHRFITHSGVNLPWSAEGRYGWDFGAHPWGGDPGGFHVNRASLEADFAYLREHHVKLCRIFLFCDFRTGLDLDNDGNILGFDSYVAHDMETLLEVAATNGIRLIPVLMDYMIANGVAYENGAPVGEYPEYITDATRRNQLLTNALQPFIEQFGGHDSIYAWDIINEPRLATAVSQPEMRSFIEGIAAVIRAAAPDARVTVGYYDRYHLDDYGHGVCDLTQVHYYDHMSYYWNFNTPAIEISDKPTFFGEIAPDNVADQPNTAIENGYTGVLFWSLNKDYDFPGVADAYSAWVTARFAEVHDSFRIAGMRVGGQPETVELDIVPTYDGGAYRVEGRHDIRGGSWQTLQSFSGPAEPGTATVSLPYTTTQMFYRVKADF